DNLQKLLKDCMTKTKYWTDDAQVASELSQKFHSKITGIWIMVRELEAIDEE
ncbi:MAG: RusA family crossover junction endodeoxyribonuclease, partial [Clostridiales bacterium]|nr:RusA family crossover junction endodeoxyribonuclease [Clostridiales bacterium]MDY5702358.1 RusA family crossover junction endodeoxyribonuclease [Eubacteriales bacterium]